ncbi:MAG: alpha/beta hydrolase [Gammaproteobacteria bacterium]|nr:alpha/beta hydrolase [Gammaproteobacteria bacterium]
MKATPVFSSQGMLATYTYGEGKDIWLIHHWSKSSLELLPLIKKLARQGYCVHALDLPAHGCSEGTYTNIIQMINAFDDFADSSLMPETVITHGLGACVVANSQFFQRYSNNLVMLNPRLNAVEVLHKVADRYGISSGILMELMKQLYRRYGVHLRDLDATGKIAEFPGFVKVVEETAKISTFNLSKQLA